SRPAPSARIVGRAVWPRGVRAMTEPSSHLDTRDVVFGDFYQELEEDADRAAVVRKYAQRYPQWAKEFEEEAARDAGLLGTPPAADEPYPTELPDFRVMRKIGEGGMGVVFEAEQLSLKRRVALKVRRGAVSPEDRARFQREQEVLAELHHT